MALRWRYGIIAGLFLAIFSLYPQGKLIYNRGWSAWNGHYAYNDIDEVAYASYVKALIDGRPRKNDPYTGRDDTPETPQAESLFSIQFAGPYTIVIPARIFGIPATWAMTISGAIAAFLTALAIFWLIGMITGDSLYAMADALIVLCLGALFAGEGAIGEILSSDGFSYPYFPGFRRYIPAMAFPAFFLLVGLVWKILAQSPKSEVQRPQGSQGSSLVTHPSSLTIGLVILAFAYCVFTYFYVWTTAVAWLGCLTLLFLIFRPDGVLRDLKWLGILAVGCVAALIPYSYLLSHRSESIDQVQMLVLTHRSDLTRTPELIGFVTIFVVVAAVALGVLKLKDRGTLFALSLAITPALLFNQQVITGRELQPIHYQVFIGNYVAGLAMVVTFALLWRAMQAPQSLPWRIVIAGFAVAAAAWGFVECHYTVRVLDDVNIARDEALPVGRRLAELANGDPDPHKSSVLYLPIAEADDFPTLAPQPVLWARHQHIFSDVTWQENKERYYQQLYYYGITPDDLAERIKSGDDIVSLIALFGWGRHSDRLNSDYKPLLNREVDEEAALYAQYLATFDAHASNATRLSYVVAPADYTDNYFENLDKWYERYDQENYGKYVLYKLRLK
ncbi:MAG: hypothetical protein JO314_05985 [Acidobacteria bacterium]|nr:hypothetical protein [Acidobacteriota bacterium]